MSLLKLAINECPNHPGRFSISVDGETSGVRLTPKQSCCGRFTTLYEWPIDAKMAREAIIQFGDALRIAEAEAGDADHSGDVEGRDYP